MVDVKDAIEKTPTGLLFDKIKQKQTGGKYIGQGTYGCVFSPPLLCKNDKARKTGVGKMFINSEYAENEVNELEFVKQIDPSGKFTVQMSELCDVPKTNIDKEDELEKCSKKKSGVLVTYDQIILKEKGVDLYKYASKDSYKFNELLDGFINLANGLIEFEKHSICHRDIKPSNVILIGDEASSYKMKYIDFGLSLKYKEIYTEKQYNILSHPYIYYPPEFNLYVDHIVKTESTFDDLFNKYKKVIKCFTTIGLSKDTLRAQFEQFQTMNKHSSIVNIDKYFTQYSADKVDVFSLGITMLEMYTHKNCITDDLNDTQKALINGVLMSCINFNPVQRFTPTVLLSNLKNIKNAKETSYKMSKSVSSPPKQPMSKEECKKFFTIKELKEKAKEMKTKKIYKNSMNKKIVMSGTKAKLCDGVSEFLDEKQFPIPDNHTTLTECTKQYTLKQMRLKSKELKANQIHTNRHGDRIVSSGKKEKVCGRIHEFLEKK